MLGKPINAISADINGKISSFATAQSQSQGIAKLDYLVLTHPDSDHIGGAPVIITKFEIDKVFILNFIIKNSKLSSLSQGIGLYITATYNYACMQPNLVSLWGHSHIKIDLGTSLLSARTYNTRFMPTYRSAIPFSSP